MMFLKRGLNGMEFSVFRQSLDRGDLRAISLNREHGAGFDGLTVHMYDARAALAGVASDVCAGQIELIAKVVNQQRTRLDVVVVDFAVDCD
jgi:hypothetical protein